MDYDPYERNPIFPTYIELIEQLSLQSNLILH